MSFRITPHHLANETIRYSQSHNANLARLQRQISSGLRIEKPSDQPGILSSLLTNKASVARIEVDIENITSARSKLNQSVSQLISAKEAIQRAKSLNLQGVQSFDERETIAEEIDGILDLVVHIANTTDGGKPLYAGTSNSLEPFRIGAKDAEGRTSEVIYEGSEDRSSVVIGVRSSVETLYSGSEIFASMDRQETVFVGGTGVAAGPSIDNARGFGELLVAHTSTTFGGASGLQPGLSSLGGDTILGQHTLVVDAVNGTLSLDNATPVDFVAGDTDVRVVGHSGAVVHVDTSSLVGGFTGSIMLQGDGTLSIDGGASTTAIDFTDNQAVVDSTTGDITYVDTRAVNLAGSEIVEYPGTGTAFEVLINLRDDLLNTRGLTQNQWHDAMERHIGEVERVHDHLLSVISEQSATLENLDAFEDQTEVYQLDTQHEIAAVESTDIPEAVVQFQAAQNALQYTYAISLQLMDTNILDFLT
jgi:flagellin-like hook-associated protein FlgL